MIINKIVTQILKPYIEREYQCDGCSITLPVEEFENRSEPIIPPFVNLSRYPVWYVQDGKHYCQNCFNLLNNKE